MSVLDKNINGERMNVETQDSVTVGAATVQLTTTATTAPCVGVWVMAPTASHTVAETNPSIVLVGNASGGNGAGGAALATDNHVGFFYPTTDPTTVYLTGTTAGDTVEYQTLVLS